MYLKIDKFLFLLHQQIMYLNEYILSAQWDSFTEESASVYPSFLNYFPKYFNFIYIHSSSFIPTCDLTTDTGVLSWLPR